MMYIFGYLLDLMSFIDPTTGEFTPQWGKRLRDEKQRMLKTYPGVRFYIIWAGTIYNHDYLLILFKKFSLTHIGPLFVSAFHCQNKKIIPLTFKHMQMEPGGVNGVDDKSIMFEIPGWSVLQVFGDSAALFCQNFKGSAEVIWTMTPIYI